VLPQNPNFEQQFPLLHTWFPFVGPQAVITGVGAVVDVVLVETLVEATVEVLFISVEFGSVIVEFIEGISS
jgi:hypothetical protein